MKFEEKEIILKNGQICILRSPTEKDAEAMLNYLKQTSSETYFMARYEDEITLTVDAEKEILTAILSDPERIMISAYIDGKLIANCGFSRIAPFERAKHRAEFGMSIIKEFWNVGIGSLLLSTLIESAKIAGYEQLELEVVAENERAVTLYEKFGFELFGTRKNTFKFRDGNYCACHLMLKNL